SNRTACRRSRPARTGSPPRRAARRCDSRNGSWLWLSYPSLPAGLFVQERVEDKRFLFALGCCGGRIRTVGGIEHARRLLGFGLGVSRPVDVGRGRAGGGRRQVQRALAAAAGKRERAQAKDNDGPPRAGRAKL